MSQHKSQQDAVAWACGTEPPWSSPLLDEHRQGTYHCALCDAALFASDSKFNSGSGWPSFFQTKTDLETQDDHRHGMTRTEIKCPSCGAHLGHVFPDGPPPTGLRYCVNGIVLRFLPDGGETQA